MNNFPNIASSIQDTVNSIPYALPEMTVSAGFLLAIILDLFLKKAEKIVFSISLLTLILAMAFLGQQYSSINQPAILFNGMFRISTELLLFKGLALFAALLSLLFFAQDERLTKHPKGINDFYSVFLGAVLAMLMLISSANLLMAYISVEMLSLASYLMVSYATANEQQAEAGLKYVLFGVAASALMLYGISFLYGFSGTLNLYNDSIALGLNAVPVLTKNLVLLFFIAGLGFKLSFVPFHFWTPDAYQSAPTSVTSFLATVPKIAVFAFLFAINHLFHLTGGIYTDILLAAAIASMIVGNVMAVFQDDPKRLMAYSSIGHTGFLLMLFVLPQAEIFTALFFYLLIYVLMNIGAFTSLSFFEEVYGITKIHGLKGLGKKSPFIGVSLVICMVSLIGLPPTAGFIAKFRVFALLVNEISGFGAISVLLIVAVITTVISLFYYFLLPLNLFLRENENSVQNKQFSIFKVCFPVIIAVLLIVFGIFPHLI